MKNLLNNLSFIFILIISLTINACGTQTSIVENQESSDSDIVSNIKFEYISSTVSNNELTINLLINSLTAEKAILIKNQAPSIFDSMGNEYTATDFKIGNNTIEQGSYWGKAVIAKLYQDVPIKAVFKFSGVPNDLKNLKLFQFNFFHLIDGRGVKFDMRKEYNVRIKSLDII